MNSDDSLPSILFVWDQFGPYHMDRLEALGAALAGQAHVVGVELASISTTYGWDVTGAGRSFEKRTLFGERPVETLRTVEVARMLIRQLQQPAVKALFVSGYERPSHFLASVIARQRGIRTVVMLDSKYDDKPRRAWLEAAKMLLMLPYHGGFAAGRRSAEYLRLLGLRDRLITRGYDAVSLERLRNQAGSQVSELRWEERPFVAVARYVPKKNLHFLLNAYAEYRATSGTASRRLILCGGGPLEESLRSLAAKLGVGEYVSFTGFAGQAQVAAIMRDALCLLLPSLEEQWGLVVNEALAFDLPVLVSSNVGATDLLVEDGVNGFVINPHDLSGWKEAMVRLGTSRQLWEELSSQSARRAPLGDVPAFVQGVLPHLEECKGLLRGFRAADGGSATEV